METNDTNNNINNKSDYQKVLRPTSIEKDSCVYPGTKRILNWKFSSIHEPNSYLNFDEVNCESFEEVRRFSDC